MHAEAYGIMLSKLVGDMSDRDRVFDAMDTVSSIRGKAEWTMDWIETTDRSFGERLVAFAAVEGIFFSSSFAAMFWLKGRGIMPGLSHANELIARDEGMHTSFACLLHGHLVDKASESKAQLIVRNAVELEQQFFFGG